MKNLKKILVMWKVYIYFSGLLELKKDLKAF